MELTAGSAAKTAEDVILKGIGWSIRSLSGEKLTNAYSCDVICPYFPNAKCLGLSRLFPHVTLYSSSDKGKNMDTKEIRTGKCRTCGVEFEYEVYPSQLRIGRMGLFLCPRCTEPLFHICALSLLGIRMNSNPHQLKSQSAVA
jgi:hypothetical protein